VCGSEETKRRASAGPLRGCFSFAQPRKRWAVQRWTVGAHRKRRTANVKSSALGHSRERICSGRSGDSPRLGCEVGAGRWRLGAKARAHTDTATGCLQGSRKEKPRPGTAAGTRMYGVAMARGSSGGVVERAARGFVVVESEAKVPAGPAVQHTH
jgi:hypothetical protein